MKMPPLVLGATVLFWGWQSEFLIPGAIMAVVLELWRCTKFRWDLSDEDFARIWTFCTLLFMLAAVYAFTSNEGPSRFANFFQDPNFSTQGRAGTSSARTAASLIRWLPMVFFLFMGAQAYSTREGIPLHTVSIILSRRWRTARLPISC